MKITITVPVSVELDAEALNYPTKLSDPELKKVLAKIRDAITDNVFDCMKGCDRSVLDGVVEYAGTELRTECISIGGLSRLTHEEA